MLRHLRRTRRTRDVARLLAALDETAASRGRRPLRRPAVSRATLAAAR